jgi:LacI family transcriptional regulator
MVQRRQSDTSTKRATIRDVAKLAGVDPSLVSRIVNKKPNVGVSESTRKRVLAAVSSLNYQANSAARVLKTSRTDMLGLLLPDIENPMYQSIVSGVEQRCTERGLGLILGNYAQGESINHFTALMKRGQVDGLLVASGTLTDNHLKEEILDKYPNVVLVNRKVKGNVPSVILNDELGAEIAVEHLVSSGAKLIAGIFGPSHIDTAQRRRKGFEDACRKAKVKHQFVDMPSWGMNAGLQAGEKILSKSPKPDAIFASTIMMGIGVLRAAARLHISIPKDLKIVSMHDSGIANFVTPTLSTVDMPTKEMGIQAVDLLLRSIEGEHPASVIVNTEPRLIVRESSSSK